MKKILMVCLGNICRSPLAEGILKSKVNGKDVFVDSAGTAAYHVGNLPDERSIEVAKKHQIDITNQSARKFTMKDFDIFDSIFVMDKSNYHNVVALARDDNDIAKVSLILDASEKSTLLEVPDPYYGGNEGFDKVYTMLDDACNEIAKSLI
ncbi:low molecular weight protein-tyrosine-phosphatase [Polaribacter tangerinus]|uniref:low molecular weight protein-tyrosine-phosphatase n=1 Tax=Polaribacter tangerinus TaxID=1920034 RepID=UPI000B4B580B|nr:low molecular weight protein-tyrosine-phosphatase [Polaribacter tangerinus]